MNQTLSSYLSQFECYQATLTKLQGFFGAEGGQLFLTTGIFLVGILAIVAVMAAIGGLGTYAERKISADIQMRYGPNRVGPYGLLQFLADGVKMFLKEDILPNEADKFLFTLAPIFSMVGVFATFAVLPFSFGYTLTHLNVGLFYFLGVTSLVGLGTFLGGYASNNKWSFLGGMRGASQVVSYEIPVTITILMIALLSGSLSFQTVVASQGTNVFEWFIFHNPFAFIGFFVFFTGALAETNRAPFDLPEAESELVSGFHTEYSGMRFAFFALAEYMEVFVVCAVAVALFLGGHQMPFTDMFSPAVKEIVGVIFFMGKSFFLYYVVIWVRWTLPRLRVDQLMSVCWKYLTPIALFNLVGAAFWAYFFKGQSIYQLIF